MVLLSDRCRLQDTCQVFVATWGGRYGQQASAAGVRPAAVLAGRAGLWTAAGLETNRSVAAGRRCLSAAPGRIDGCWAAGRRASHSVQSDRETANQRPAPQTHSSTDWSESHLGQEVGVGQSTDHGVHVTGFIPQNNVEPWTGLTWVHLEDRCSFRTSHDKISQKKILWQLTPKTSSSYELKEAETLQTKDNKTFAFTVKKSIFKQKPQLFCSIRNIYLRSSGRQHVTWTARSLLVEIITTQQIYNRFTLIQIKLSVQQPSSYIIATKLKLQTLKTEVTTTPNIRFFFCHPEHTHSLCVHLHHTSYHIYIIM